MSEDRQDAMASDKQQLRCDAVMNNPEELHAQDQ